MAKRLMCIVLSLLMIMSIMPMGVIADDAVAQVGDNTYSDLSTAISAAVDGDTVKILSDFTLSSALTISKSITLDLNSHTIAFGSSAKITLSGTTTIKNGTFSASGVSTSISNQYTLGAMINVDSGAIVSMENVNISGDQYPICVKGTLKITGGTITGKSIYVIFGGNLTINDGTTLDMAAAVGTTYYNAIFMGLGSTVTINGGTIKSGLNTFSRISNTGYGSPTDDVPNWKITITGGEFYVSTDIAYTGVNYENNYSILGIATSNNYTSNTASWGDVLISGGTFNTYLALTSSGNEDTTVYSAVISSNSSYNVDTAGGSVTITVSSSTDYVAQNTNTSTSYEKLQDAIDAASEGDEIQLLTDISDEPTITVDYTKSLTLDLAGCTLTGSITITGGDLTLTDTSTAQTGTVTGGVTVNAKVVFRDNTTYFLLNDGTLKSLNEMKTDDFSNINTSAPSSGEYSNAIGYAGKGSFTMNGGTISGGVTVSNNSSFTMADGTISNASGTGVTLNNAGQNSQVFTVVFNSDGTIYSISENKSITDDLANYFTMSGGTITGCYATGSGGGVSVGQCCVFNMSGGTITSNSASIGGGVYVGDGYFTMTAGAIYGNTASSYAADIYTTGGDTVTIIAASSMTGLSGFAWYTDESGDRYSETNITNEVTTTTFNDGEPHSLIAVSPVATPTLYGRTLTLDGAVGVTFYFDMGDLDADDYTLTAVIDSDGEDRKISGISYTNTKTINGKTYYRYTVYVNANEFNLDIDATLYYKETTKVATYTPTE